MAVLAVEALEDIVGSLGSLSLRQLILLKQIAAGEEPTPGVAGQEEYLVAKELIEWDGEKSTPTITPMGELVLHLNSALGPVVIHRTALALNSSFTITRRLVSDLAGWMGHEHVLIQGLTEAAKEFEMALENLLNYVAALAGKPPPTGEEG